MSRYLDDAINTLLNLIWASKVYKELDSCDIYLRSTCQKHLFAERRLSVLKRKITKYKKGREVKQYNEFPTITYPSALPIEMEFDHCILSLRSCLEHLAQLINALVPLGLSPRQTQGKVSVSLKSVIDTIRNNEQFNRNIHLAGLSSFLESEVKQNWSQK